MTEEGFTLWLPGVPVYRHQPDVRIVERRGARVGLRKGAVWREKIFASVYPNEMTEAAEAAWTAVWLATDDRPYLAGPITAEIQERRLRPKYHLLADGVSLSAEGIRSPFPAVRPDVDNVEKACFDALKGLAFDDDAVIVNLLHTKRYVISPRLAGTMLTVRPAEWERPDLQLRLVE